MIKVYLMKFIVIIVSAFFIKDLLAGFVHNKLFILNVVCFVQLLHMR